jgi:hypothetical protein
MTAAGAAEDDGGNTRAMDNLVGGAGAGKETDGGDRARSEARSSINAANLEKLVVAVLNDLCPKNEQGKRVSVRHCFPLIVATITESFTSSPQNGVGASVHFFKDPTRHARYRTILNRSFTPVTMLCLIIGRWCGWAVRPIVASKGFDPKIFGKKVPITLLSKEREEERAEEVQGQRMEADKRKDWVEARAYDKARRPPQTGVHGASERGVAVNFGANWADGVSFGAGYD